MKKIFTVLTALFTGTLLFGQTIIGTCNYSLPHSSIPPTSTLYKTSAIVSRYDIPVVYDYDTYTISDTFLLQNNISVENIKLKTHPQLPANVRQDLSGYLLERGSTKILVSIGIGLGTTALACPIMICRSTIVGGVILGFGGLTSLITLISGVSDLRKSGIILEGGSVVFKFNNANFNQHSKTCMTLR